LSSASVTRILDYGVNNLNSVEKAVRFLGHKGEISKAIGDADRLIIPGVGAFGQAMHALAPVADEVRAFAASGRPILGICLGQQLLMDGSDEHGQTFGLGLVPGWVKYLPKTGGLKVPHMGWTPVKFGAQSQLGSGVSETECVYFVHSLYCECADPTSVVATADYGITFCAALRSENIWGTQFHPEKSGTVGLKILENFLAWS
jgi:glutamine amidotransferase